MANVQHYANVPFKQGWNSCWRREFFSIKWNQCGCHKTSQEKYSIPLSTHFIHLLVKTLLSKTSFRKIDKGFLFHCSNLQLQKIANCIWKKSKTLSLKMLSDSIWTELAIIPTTDPINISPTVGWGRANARQCPATRFSVAANQWILIVSRYYRPEWSAADWTLGSWHLYRYDQRSFLSKVNIFWVICYKIKFDEHQRNVRLETDSFLMPSLLTFRIYLSELSELLIQN